MGCRHKSLSALHLFLEADMFHQIIEKVVDEVSSVGFHFLDEAEHSKEMPFFSGHFFFTVLHVMLNC